MANTNGMKHKFVVLKIDDVNKYCSSLGRDRLTASMLEIKTGRMQHGKNPDNQYLVINTDEPYADEVIEILKRHGHWG